jgi:hypothetical protein
VAAREPMDGLDGDHVVTPTMTSHSNEGDVFSVRGRCRRFITDTANRLLDLGCGNFKIRRLEDLS